MQKTFNFFYAFLLALLGFGVTLMAEGITLTTYYPAPYGAYDELSTTGNTYLATTSGNVGIGTTAPGTKFQIFPSTGGINGNIMTIGGLGYNTIVGMDTTGAYIYQNSASRNLSLGSNSSRLQLVLAASGNVGIGKSPNYPLDVLGDINTTGDIRKSGSAYVNPDYVFEPGYSLMPVSKLGSYVLENRHLPNMPSTEDIKQGGVKLFEHNRLLLEKIEEAYLYIIELEKRIEKLERR
jgi:hypothetical protein